jgi:hypothetical protein
MTEQQRAAMKAVPSQWLEPGAVVPVTVASVHMLIEALRAALAQQEQGEPVAWWYAGKAYNFHGEAMREARADGYGDEAEQKVRPLVLAGTTPRKRLTADEVFASNEIMAINAGLGLRIDQLMNLIRAVERAHGIGDEHE